MKNMKSRLLKLFIVAVMFLAGPVFGANLPEYVLKTKMPVESVEVINTYPHDSEAYTQGLLVYDGFLYESTGLYGKSGVFKKDIKTGKILQGIWNDKKYFGEGIVILKDKIYQLTWQNETLVLYDAGPLKEIKKIEYQGEGWGLTTNGRHLFMSNGSSTLFVRDPASFKIIRKMDVRDGITPVERLNELEFINGEIWANIYLEDLVVRISPKNGKVKGWIDLSSLRSYLPGNAQVDVINGIAYDQKTDRMFVTGKHWPRLFEIKVKR